MGKEKLRLTLSERKFVVSSAWKTYLAEMYVMQKAQETHTVKDDKGNEFTIRLGDYMDDYQTQRSLDVMSAIMELIEPEIWKEKIEGKDLVNLSRETIKYITGEDVLAQTGQMSVTKPKPAESDAKNAVQAKDLVSKKKIIVTKALPKGAYKK